ncbi:hypothetical protein K2W90_02610 [Candidatus Babeliales bacterium]|nr:hypothetical protein [Candidatus Babeliales bacterium]
MTFKTIFLATTLLMSSGCNAFTESPSIQETSPQVILKEVTINTAQLAALWLPLCTASATAHELGHALAGLALFESLHDLEIHIGGISQLKENTKTEELFSVGTMYFHTDAWQGHGYTIFNGNLNETNFDLKLNAMIAAGPLAGILFNYAALVAASTYCSYADDKKLSSAMTSSLRTALCPFNAILKTENISPACKRVLLNASFLHCLYLTYNVFYGLTPFLGDKNGDGVRLWKAMGVEGKALTAASALSVAGYLTSIAFIVKNFCQAHKELFAQHKEAI